ncbi:MAG: hypothetical protein WBB01_22785, partial [Phormidesmis sp.]
MGIDSYFIKGGKNLTFMSNPKTSDPRLTKPRRIMLFDLECVGHHANYIRHLIRYCGENELPIMLDIVVSPQFVEKHLDVIKTVDKYPQASINFIPVSAQEFQSLEAHKYAFSQALNRLREWRLLCKYAAELNVDHCLVLYLDTSELPLILGLKPPCPLSGIYFRPTFHYQTFTAHHYPPESWTKQLRERLFIHRMLH